MEEIWKPVVGYEGLYEVSSLGRVKSLARYSKPYNNHGTICRSRIRERIMKGTPDEDGYLEVALTDPEGIQKYYRINRLVAIAFIPNPDNLPFVNHKDECKTNNIVDNLEWCTNEYNMNYGTRNARISKAQTGKIHTDLSKAKMSAAKKGKTWVLLPNGRRKWISVLPN